MTDEQLNQLVDRLEALLERLAVAAERLADNAPPSFAEIRAEDELIMKQQAALQNEVPRRYLSGRWIRRDGDHFAEGPRADRHDNNPAGYLRPLRFSGD